MEKNHSGEIAFEIDKEVRRIIDEAYEQARVIIENNRPLLDAIVEELLEQETLTAEQINAIVVRVEGNDTVEETGNETDS